MPHVTSSCFPVASLSLERRCLANCTSMRGKAISKTAVAAAWASPESKEAKAAGEKAAALGWRRMLAGSNETLPDSYALFSRLRALGIRAHSWV